MNTNTPNSHPALAFLRPIGAVVLLMLVIYVFLSVRSNSEGSLDSPSTSNVSQEQRVTLDNRPTYKGFKTPIHEFSTPGDEVKQLRLPNGRVFVGQPMLNAMAILPSAEVEDTEDDPEITITSPFGNHVGMRYVNRYRVSGGRTVVIRFQRKVPRRPFVGEAGTVQQPFVVYRITVQ